jgi:glycosyltransferase involved in cell wall biosynthesis
MRHQRQAEMESGDTATIDATVVVPVCNSPDGIRVTLNALVRQAYPKQAYEVIVVDNRSSDETPHVVEEYVTAYEGLVRLYYQDEIQSSYAARNTGIEHARGQIIAFVDADMWMDEDWLAAVVKYMVNTQAQYMGCGVVIKSEKDTLASLYDKVTGFPIEEYIRRHHFATTACLTVTRDLVNRIGVFRPLLVSGGDNEFGNRAHSCGVELHYASHIVLYHPARASLMSLVKKAFRIGRGRGQLGSQLHVPYSKRAYEVFRMILPPDPRSFGHSLASYEQNAGYHLGLLASLRLYLLRMLLKWIGLIGYLRATQIPMVIRGFYHTGNDS